MPHASHDERFEGGWTRWFRRRERALIVAWLCTAAAAVAFAGVWGVAWGGAERAVDALDSAWVRRLEPLAARVKAGDHLAAAAALEQLDAECPATFVKHRYDRERERLLGLLAECQVALDRRAAARATLAKLVLFDPRNYDNHFRLAEAERSFGDELAAKQAYAAVLALHPSHLPSVRAQVAIDSEAGDHAAVVATFERYVDGWLIARVRWTVGDRALELEVPVDGRVHAFELALPLPRGWRGGACVETEGFSMRVERITFAPPLRAGILEPRESLALSPENSWSAHGGTRAGPGELSATALGARLCSPEFELPAGASMARCEIAVFKTLPRELWERVKQSYEALLDGGRLSAIEQRTRVGGVETAGTVLVE